MKYLDENHNSMQVRSVKTINSFALLAPDLDEGAQTEYLTNKWEEFLRLATEHLPKDVKFSHVAGSTCRYKVYLPDDVIEMGELMMEYRTCDPSDGDPYINYHVTSPKITNRRYCPYASPWDYRTKSSQSLDKAVRNARVALRPNTLADVGRVSLEGIRDKWNDIKDTGRRALTQARANLGVSNSSHNSGTPLLDEAVRLCEMGLVKFSDDVDSKLGAYMKANETMKSNDEVRYATMCWVKGDTVLAHTACILNGSLRGDENKGYTTFDRNFMHADKQTYVNNAPEDIISKVSVLSMLDDNEFVEEVGYKFNDSVYYILK
tara:strand:+ start:570 stop:1529 length:960 start_codon:yes stop_codon:yes gene_type:complete